MSNPTEETNLAIINHSIFHQHNQMENKLVEERQIVYLMKTYNTWRYINQELWNRFRCITTLPETKKICSHYENLRLCKIGENKYFFI